MMRYYNKFDKKNLYYVNYHIFSLYYLKGSVKMCEKVRVGIVNY